MNIPYINTKKFISTIPINPYQGFIASVTCLEDARYLFRHCDPSCIYCLNTNTMTFACCYSYYDAVNFYNKEATERVLMEVNNNQ